MPAGDSLLDKQAFQQFAILLLWFLFYNNFQNLYGKQLDKRKKQQNLCIKIRLGCFTVRNLSYFTLLRSDGRRWCLSFPFSLIMSHITITFREQWHEQQNNSLRWVTHKVVSWERKKMKEEKWQKGRSFTVVTIIRCHHESSSEKVHWKLCCSS